MIRCRNKKFTLQSCMAMQHSGSRVVFNLEADFSVIRNFRISYYLQLFQSIHLASVAPIISL